MAAARKVATARGHQEAQPGSAFTREEAAAGCADLDDEEDCAGEADSRVAGQSLLATLFRLPKHSTSFVNVHCT